MNEILVVFSSFTRHDQYYPFEIPGLSFVSENRRLHVYNGRHRSFIEKLPHCDPIFEFVAEQLSKDFTSEEVPSIRLLIHHPLTTETIQKYFPNLKVAYYSSVSCPTLYREAIIPMFKKAYKGQPFEQEFCNILNDRFGTVNLQKIQNQLLEIGTNLSWIQNEETLPQDILTWAPKYNVIQSAVTIFNIFRKDVLDNPEQHDHYYSIFKKKIDVEFQTSL